MDIQREKICQPITTMMLSNLREKENGIPETKVRCKLSIDQS